VQRPDAVGEAGREILGQLPPESIVEAELTGSVDAERLDLVEVIPNGADGLEM
jgi:hypothetical protein